ncbi:DUF4336 domain-containing protein [Phenylobacterium sp.]|uniref:DUF4336 domain-containing protein n=1 Tax=Phenylobacterium sp. TaxID=1871053 RepID=UPI002F9391DD
MARLQPFGEEIWLADGPQAAVAGFAYPTRMAVIRLGGRRLFVWSPVALDAALRVEVEALGDVRWLAAPNSLHHLFLAEWKAAYPAAALWAAPGLRGKRPDLAFDGDLGETAPPDWADEIDQAPVHGNLITTEVVFFHRRSRTVLFTDLIQHFPGGWFRGWRALVAGLDLMTAAEPQVPRKFRTGFVRRRAARDSLARILDWPAEKVVMAHGAPVQADGAAFLRSAFRWLGAQPAGRAADGA